MELLVVSQNGCAPCKKVKNYLNVNEVEYKEFNISTQEDVKIDSTTFTVDDLEVMGTPVTILFDGDEEITRVQGFDVDNLNVLISQL